MAETALPTWSAMDEAQLRSALGEECWKIREKCLADPFYLGTEILGYDYDDAADFHIQTRDAMVADESFLLLAPRGHGKTVLCNVVGVVWEILRDPDVRILLCHGVLDKAQRIQKEATDHFRKNDALRALFPEHAPQSRSEDPTITSFTTPARKKILMAPSVLAGAPGSTVTGFHFDIIMATDLVNEQNTPAPLGMGSADAMDTVVQHVKTYAPLLDATKSNARIQVNGTRWDIDDAWGYMIDNWSFMKVIISRILDDDQGMPIPVWKPITVEKLVRDRDMAGFYLWLANYRNDPTTDEIKLFRREWFVDYENAPEHMSVAITVDIGYSDRKTGDRTAIVTTGICETTGDLYVLSAQAGRWSPGEVVQRIVAAYEYYDPDWVGVESNSYQKVLIHWLADVSRRDDLRLPLRKLMPDESKVRRAFNVRNHAEAYGIYVRPSMRNPGGLVEECVKFTGEASTAKRKDDLVDALCYRGQDLVKRVRHGLNIRDARDDGPDERDLGKTYLDKFRRPARSRFRICGGTG